jgi:hypothetical protein
LGSDALFDSQHSTGDGPVLAKAVTYKVYQVSEYALYGF